jgi:hypothetical protein
MDGEASSWHPRASGVSGVIQALLADAAIFGQMGGDGMLSTASCSSCCFLLGRIFSSCRATLHPPAQPTTFVPGWSWGGAAPELFVAGGFQGFNCFVAILFRVLCVKEQGLVVFSCFFRGLLVIIH